MIRNTSQDPDYEGLPYHEKKFHKTHFGVRRKLKLRAIKPPTHEWVRVGPGRYVRRKIEHAEKEN